MAAETDITNPYYDIYRHAGEEVSSSLEGRHILLLESDLVHPAHADGLVDKGDPVAFWDGVGVALKSAQAATDKIPIDTEGIWRLEVENTGATNWGTIVVGQVLFITAGGALVDDWTSGFAIFGLALQPITGLGSMVIAVKVHWMYPYWYYDTGE